MNDNVPYWIVFHCSAYRSGGTNQLAIINEEHRDRGFDESSLGYYVGYHVLIANGIAYRTRRDLEHGDHAAERTPIPVTDGKSMNFHSLSVCVDFNGDYESVPVNALALLKTQIQYWMAQYNIPLERVLFHRDVTSAKTCPGSSITKDWLHSFLASAPAVPPVAPVAVEELRKKITLLQTLVMLLQQLLFLRKQQGLGSSFAMQNNLMFPSWYESTSGPAFSATLMSLAGNIIPVINFALQTKGINILPESVNFWITLAVFAFFSVRAAIGYVRAKITLQTKVMALQGQLQSMGASPVV